MKKLLTATALAVTLVTSACSDMSAADTSASGMKYPNWFAYQLAWINYWDEHYGDGHPSERARPYLDCSYTHRVCFDGHANYAGGRMQAFLGVIVDGEDRKKVLAHVQCRGNFESCENYDKGIDIKGRQVTMPDMPITCVEEMAKNGTECRGYSFSLGFAK
jgi:hypothetical protein